MNSNSRSIPKGLYCLLDTFSHTGTPALAIGTFLFGIAFLLAFQFQGAGIVFRTMLPWYWNDAGLATITSIEQGFNMIDDEAEAMISYTYHDPQGNEHTGYCTTKKKKDFFAVGDQSLILKFQQSWSMTILAELDFWERYPFLRSLLTFSGLAGGLVLYGLAFRYIGYKTSRWKVELLRDGTHTIGTFLRNDKAPIFFRVFGLKKHVFEYRDDSDNRHEASFVRKRNKREGAEVDVFFDPLRPERSFILQSCGETKMFRYSLETDAFVVARFFTILGWFLKLMEYFIWGMVLYFFIGILLLRL